MATSLRDSYWLGIDTETTGLEPPEHHIVELGLVLFRAGRCVASVTQLVNPGRPISAEASETHGLTDEDVADAPSIDEAWHSLRKLVDQAQVIVGYNIPFDNAFLAAELGPWWESYRNARPVVDPLVVVRLDKVGRYWRGKGRHKLTAVADRLRVRQAKPAHRAASDALTTCRVLRKLLRHLPDDAHEAAALVAKERDEQDKRFQAWLATQQAAEGEQGAA